MDDADRAKVVEQAHRKRALALLQDAAEREKSEGPIMIDGVAHCRDCKEPIPTERLAARPDAARCITCKEILEKRRNGS